MEEDQLVVMEQGRAAALENQQTKVVVGGHNQNNIDIKHNGDHNTRESRPESSAHHANQSSSITTPDKNKKKKKDKDKDKSEKKEKKNKNKNGSIEPVVQSLENNQSSGNIDNNNSPEKKKKKKKKKEKEKTPVTTNEDSSNRQNHNSGLFKDSQLCDYCGKALNPSSSSDDKSNGQKVCLNCRCVVFCSQKCHHRVRKPSASKKEKASSGQHHLHTKEQCSALQRCQAAPLTSSVPHLSKLRVTPTQIGIFQHGNDNATKVFCVMERKEWHHPTESDREVILASTSELSWEPMLHCLIDAILHPNYDTDWAGPRRPHRVCLQKASFLAQLPEEGLWLFTKLGNTLVRLGIEIVDFDDQQQQNRWCQQWYNIQHFETAIGVDDAFRESVSQDRWRPLSPDGQSRKELEYKLPDDLLHFDVKDFPARHQIVLLPPENSPLTQGLWVVQHRGWLYIFYHGSNGFDGGPEHRLTLQFQHRVPLQPSNHRPFPGDVVLAIHRVCWRLGIRPNGCWLGQPSICSHDDVKIFEDALNGSVIQGKITLGAMHSMETQIAKRIQQNEKQQQQQQQGESAGASFSFSGGLSQRWCW